MIPKGNIEKWRIYFMKTTIPLNNVLMANIDFAVANYPDLKKEMFYVLIDLIIRHSKYNEGMHAHLMTEILRGQQFLGKTILVLEVLLKTSTTSLGN
jgi:hypothetical protein